MGFTQCGFTGKLQFYECTTYRRRQHGNCDLSLHLFPSSNKKQRRSAVFFYEQLPLAPKGLIKFGPQVPSVLKSSLEAFKGIPSYVSITLLPVTVVAVN